MQQMAPSKVTVLGSRAFDSIKPGDVLICTTQAEGTERYKVVDLRTEAGRPHPLVRLVFEESDQELGFWVTYSGNRLVGISKPRGELRALWWVVRFQIEQRSR